MNSKQFLAVCTLVALTLPALALGVGTYIDLPEGLPADILGYANILFTDMSLLVILAIGLPVGFWVIRKVISLVRAR